MLLEWVSFCLLNLSERTGGTVNTVSPLLALDPNNESGETLGNTVRSEIILSASFSLSGPVMSNTEFRVHSLHQSSSLLVDKGCHWITKATSPPPILNLRSIGSGKGCSAMNFFPESLDILINLEEFVEMDCMFLSFVKKMRVFCSSVFHLSFEVSNDFLGEFRWNECFLLLLRCRVFPVLFQDCKQVAKSCFFLYTAFPGNFRC